MKLQNPIAKGVTPDIIPTGTLRARARRNNWTKEKILRVAYEESQTRMDALQERLGADILDDKGKVIGRGDVMCERCDSPVDAGNFQILPDQTPAHRFKCE